MPKFEFDRAFQVEVLSLVFQKWDFLVFAADVIEPEYFDDKVLVWFYQTITSYYHQYNQRPSMTVVKNELLKAAKNKRIKKEEIDSFMEVYRELPEHVLAEDYIREEVIRFCKMQATKKALLEIGEMMHSEDPNVWDAIGKRLDNARSVGDDATDLGVRYFEEVEERVRLRALGDNKLVMPTGITDLDNVIGGGLEEEQMMIWMGGTGTGKSLALAHCAKRAVVGRYKVVYYTHELSADVIAKRFDSCLSRVPIMEIDLHGDTVVQKVQKWGRMYGENLIIKQYPPGQASVNTLRAHLTMLHNSGFKPDLVVVDYLDLLKPLTSYNDAYDDLGAIATDLRGLAVEFKVPLQTATQVNRSGMQSDVVELHHISDSLKKLFVADIVVPICRNREEKHANRARLFTAKNRNGPEAIEIPIATAYERMAFFAPAAMNQPVESEVDSTVLQRRAPRTPEEAST